MWFSPSGIIKHSEKSRNSESHASSFHFLRSEKGIAMDVLGVSSRSVMSMEKLKKEIEEWKERLIEDLQKTIKVEIEKAVEVLFDYLWNKRLMKER